MAIIIDKELAEKTPCYGYRDKQTRTLLLHTSGAVGIITQQQSKNLCTKIEVKDKEPSQLTKQYHLKQATKTCRNQPLNKALQCLSEQLGE